MKKFLAVFLASALLLLSGCASAVPEKSADTILATTAPVAEVVSAVTDGTDITVTQLISEPVSCLHDYSLSVAQMERVERASIVVISGLGLEDFMGDALASCPNVIEAAEDVAPIETEEGNDPHIWLDPQNMILMTKTVTEALGRQYPQYAELFEQNSAVYCEKLQAVTDYGEAELKALSCRKLITFHEGFSYFAKAFDLQIAAAMEIESGSEPAAKELEQIVELIRTSGIPAIFAEQNGNTDCADIICRETGVQKGVLTTAMDLSGTDYCAAMRRNIDAIKEGLQ